MIAVLATLLLATHFYTVQAGNTLSQIAANYGTSWQVLYQANEQVIGGNPNLIYPGQQLAIPSGPYSESEQPQPSEVPTTPSPAQVPSSGVSAAPTGISIPGMPSSLANCIWMRESTDGTNPAANGNQFGIIPASGYNVAGDSVQRQEQIAGELYQAYGGSPWAADGCPGT